MSKRLFIFIVFAFSMQCFLGVYFINTLSSELMDSQSINQKKISELISLHCKEAQEGAKKLETITEQNEVLLYFVGLLFQAQVNSDTSKTLQEILRFVYKDQKIKSAIRKYIEAAQADFNAVAFDTASVKYYTEGADETWLPYTQSVLNVAGFFPGLPELEPEISDLDTFEDFEQEKNKK